MSHFHAAEDQNMGFSPDFDANDDARNAHAWREQRLATQLSLLFDCDLAVQSLRPLQHQGAVNMHWRVVFAAHTGLAPAASLILRSRHPIPDGPEEQAPDRSLAFPAQHLNSMRTQDFWHRHAHAAGAQAPKSFGTFEDQELGECLVLEDLSAPLPGEDADPASPLVSLTQSAETSSRLLRAHITRALHELSAFHCVPRPERPTTQSATLKQPPVTQPPATQPPVTRPPVTQSPVTQPPVPKLCERDWSALRKVIGFSDALALAEMAHANAVELAKKQLQAAGETALHGDFRLANLLVGASQKTRSFEIGQAQTRVYLMDFDFSGIGHPAEDLGWLSAPCWSAGAIQDQALDPSWLLDSYQTAGGQHVERTQLRQAQLHAQMRWLAIALLQARRTGQSLDALYHVQPQQHPIQVLRDALALAEQL